MAQEESDERGGAGIEAIHVKIGPLSGVVSEALESAYDLARENTRFERCRLVIEDVPVVVYCPKCAAERPVRSLQWFCCAECDTPVLEVIHGRELQVSALELSS